MKLLLTAILISFVTCKEIKKPENRIDVIRIPDDKEAYNISVIVVDSCEYVLGYIGTGGHSISHKGNCKFCAERNKKIGYIPPSRYSDTAGSTNSEFDWSEYDSVLVRHIKVGDIMLRPAKDGSYLIIHPDTTFEVHGKLQTVLKDLWERQAFAWNQYSNLLELIQK